MNTDFGSFVALTVPSGIGILVSVNLGKVVNTLQTSLINPGISLIPGLNLANLQYSPQPNIVFDFGAMISAIISFVIICLVAYLIVLFFYKTAKIDGLKKL